MMNTKKLSYIFVALALALVLAATMITVAYNNKVYADYQEIVNDNNSIVNFNQVLNIPGSSYSSNSITVSGYYVNFSNSVTTGYKPSNLTYQFISDHIYYLYIHGTATNSGIYGDDVDTSVDAIGSVKYSSTILSNISNIVRFGIFVGSNSGGNYLTYGLIDLTYMFGSGNEPNLQQCNDLFVADYYNYTLNSLISFSTLGAYVSGFNNAYDSQNIVFNSQVLYDNIFNVEQFVLQDANSNSIVAGNGDVFGFNLNTYLSSGDNLVFNIENLTTSTISDLSNTKILIGVYDNGSFISFNSINLANYSYSSVSTGYIFGSIGVSFTLDRSLNAIYFKVVSNSNSDLLLLQDFYITARSMNTYLAIQNAYSSGVRDASAYYSVGSSGYNDIFNAGKIAGLNETNPYTFGYLMSSVIEAPLNAVLSIFNFEFLGYNFKNFITVMVTLCLIVAIVRMFMGGKE